MRMVLVVLVLVGAVAFVMGASSADAGHAWAIYLVNLVFWSGLAVTGPAIAGMMQLTEARWSPAVRRIALTTAGFLPVSFVLLMIMFAGRTVLYPWVTTPLPVKSAWLNTPFFWLRTLGLAILLFGACFAFIRALLSRPDAEVTDRERARRNRLAVLVLFLWLVTVSLWGFDLVMSLDPHWYSGLFGGYFAVSALYTGFALLSILTIRAKGRGLQVSSAAVQDVAKLQFAMSIMWMYFFWSQYLVIWYGNVPVETRFVAYRFFENPWKTLAWVVFFVGWLIPFAYLLKRLTGRPPERHTPLFVIAGFGLIAIFLERVLVVFPSVLTKGAPGLGVTDVLITAGFLALFVLARRWFFARYRPTADLPH
jgi:Ni/Fe-hydrogenase subunit HybB-like protein